MNYISLKEWASAHGIDPATARQRAGRGGLSDSEKIGRDWVIDKNEPLIDHRRKSCKTSLNSIKPPLSVSLIIHKKWKKLTKSVDNH